MALGMLGRKLGMTQVNDEKGRHAVTLLEVGPCLVMQKKTQEKDGYTALKLAFGSLKEKRSNKPLSGQFKQTKSKPRRWVREFRVEGEEFGKFEEGQEIKLADVFKPGQFVDVAGRSKGRGFTGVMKRWNMKGFRASHGTHEYFRHGGSIGTRTWPGYVHKNKKMAGHYGDERVTVQNLRVVDVLADKNCLLVAGAIPGANNGFVEVRPAVQSN